MKQQAGEKNIYTPEAWISPQLTQYQLYEVPKYDGKNPEEYAYLPWLTSAVLNPPRRGGG
jgi:hypothetical protein